MNPGSIVFAGAGPGAVDLVTIRCRDAIASADVIVYAGSLVNPELLEFADAGADVHDSARLTLEETTAILLAGYRDNKKVVRLHTGDPAIYGAIAEQMVELDSHDVPYSVIPGVSAFSAAAASLKTELTQSNISQSVILTRRAGRTPVPDGEDIPSLASHGATMALYLSVADMSGLVAELRQGGYDGDTPVAVVHRASWPDEQVIRGRLDGIAECVARAGIRRQALILIGAALGKSVERSQLYAPGFAHGFRDRESDAPFLGRVAVHALTEAGCRLARHLGDAVGGDVFVSRKYPTENATAFDTSDLEGHLRHRWDRYDAHVLVMATGIAVRKTAALLRDKTSDPALVVCDERGCFAISLAGGHIGGANRLSRRLAAATGGTAVITTATDVQGIPAFDELAALQGWRIVNRGGIKQINSILLQRKPIAYVGPAVPVRQWYGDRYPIRVLTPGDSIPDDAAAVVAVDASSVTAETTLPHLELQSLPLVVGIGCRKGTAAAVIAAAVSEAFAVVGLELKRVTDLVTAEAKRDDEGLKQYADDMGLELTYYESEKLKTVDVPTPSAMPAKHVGTPSVAEAAALLHSGGRLLVPKLIYEGQVTVAVAVRPAGESASSDPRSGKIYAVGIGSGTLDTMTPQAGDALRAADVVVGYKVYIDQVTPYIGGKPTISSGMRQEIVRCRAAIAEAVAGKTVAVVCSGDAGVYGMAGLLHELVADAGTDGIEIEVIPGLTAALATAAALGAPLMNDYATISLSDLLTDRQTILDRLKAVAASGMPCVIYNPRSRKRIELLDRTLEIFTEAGGPELPCGFVRHAAREGEICWIGRIGDLPVEDVDMFTTVIIGGSDTEILNGHLVTRRGYKTRGEFQA